MTGGEGGGAAGILGLRSPKGFRPVSDPIWAVYTCRHLLPFVSLTLVFPGHVEASLCHVSEWADVALPLQVQVGRCSLEGFNARRGACG